MSTQGPPSTSNEANRQSGGTPAPAPSAPTPAGPVTMPTQPPPPDHPSPGPVAPQLVDVALRFLRGEHLLPAPADTGQWNDSAAAALKEWQKAHGVPVTGVIDSSTSGEMGRLLQAQVSALTDHANSGGAPQPPASSTTGAEPSPAAAPQQDLGGTPNPDGKFGIPGGGQIWKNDTDGSWYVVYTVPGSNPPVPLAWRIDNNDDVAAIFGTKDQTQWHVDRELTADDWTKAGVLSFGTSRQLANTSKHPFDVFTSNFDTEARVRPWLRDPEIQALTVRAVLENRTVTDAELAGTKWWQTHTAAERQWLTTYNSDPSTAHQKIEDSVDQVRKAMIAAGVANPPESLVSLIANRMTAGTWSQQYVQNQIAKLGDPYAPGSIDPTLQTWVDDLSKQGVGLNTLTDQVSKVQQLVAKWLGPAYAKGYTQQQLQDEAGKLRNDPNEQARFEGELSRQRVALFPNQPDPTRTYDDIAAPWRQVVQNMWGQQPDETDPLFEQIVKLNDRGQAEQLLRQQGIQRRITQVTNDALTAVGQATGGAIRHAQ